MSEKLTLFNHSFVLPLLHFVKFLISGYLPSIGLKFDKLNPRRGGGGGYSDDRHIMNKCYKISNTCLSAFKQNVDYQGVNSQNSRQNSKQGRP